ncbi:MAG: DUF4358 domain-containing protein [Oscillospiraceae bacterium]|nr:DUF4358 domain-containing protein [Oscillospiraceae bacterium]
MKRRNKALLTLLLGALLVLSGCGREEKAPPVMEELYDSMAAQVELPELESLGERQQRDRLGLEKEQLPQSLVMVSRDPLRLDEIWLLECADPETAQQMETLAENHRQSLCRQSRDYSPQQYALAQKARVCREGVYLGFFLGEEADRLAEIFRRAV